MNNNYDSDDLEYYYSEDLEYNNNDEEDNIKQSIIYNSDEDNIKQSIIYNSDEDTQKILNYSLKDIRKPNIVKEQLLEEDIIKHDIIKKQFLEEDIIKHDIIKEQFLEEDIIKEEDIRKPDIVVKEQLLDISDEDLDLEEAIQKSMTEYYGSCIKFEEYESQIIEEYNQETLNRKKIINPIIFEIDKVSKYDKSYVELYQLLEPILQLYIQQYLNYYECDFETYNQIFNKLSKIRLNKDKLELLKNIFILLNN